MVDHSEAPVRLPFPRHPTVPRHRLDTLLIITAFITFGLAGAFIGVGIYETTQRSSERQAECMREVRARDDARLTWEWMFDTLAERPSSEAGQVLTREGPALLDELLPRLSCDGSTVTDR